MRHLLRSLNKAIVRHKLTFVLLTAVVFVLSGVFLLSARAATFVSVPMSPSNAAGWFASSGSTLYTMIDDGVSPNVGDYVETGTSHDGGNGSTNALRLGMTEPASIGSATQLRLYVHAGSFPASRGNDTLTMRILIGGVSVASTTVVMSDGSWTTSSLTASGSWNQTQIDSMEVQLVRNVIGSSGSSSSHDDNVRIANVYVDVIHTEGYRATQEAYRWFDNDHTVEESSTFTEKTVLNGSVAFATPSNLEWKDNYVATLSTGMGASSLETFKYENGVVSSSSTIPLPSTPARSMAMTHDASYIVVGISEASSGIMYAYKRNGDYFTQIADPPSLPVGSDVVDMEWSGDNTYLSVAHKQPPFMTIYKRSGDTLTKLPTLDQPPSASSTANGQDVSWSSDGAYLGVSLADTPGVSIYKRNGDSFTKLPNISDLPPTVGRLAFSPDGTYLTIHGPGAMFVYKRNQDSFVKLHEIAHPANAPQAFSEVKWSHDSKYFAIAGFYETSIYKRSGDSFSYLGNDTGVPGGSSALAWEQASNTLLITSSKLWLEDPPRYRAYTPDISVGPGTPLAPVNTPATAPASGQPLRLRLNLGVSISDLNQGDFRLRYYHTTGVCSANASYSDITNSSSIRFYDNKDIHDGAALIADADDPKRDGVTTVSQAYIESNPFSVENSIPAGQDGIWDFALTFDESAKTTGVYCIKVVDEAGLNINGGYSHIAVIRAPSTSLSQSSYRWYKNADSATPGEPLGVQNQVANISPGSTVRLRQQVRVDDSTLNPSQKFKLQSAKKVTTCSEASYSDLVTPSDRSSNGHAWRSYVDMQENPNTSWDEAWGSVWGNFIEVPGSPEDTSTVILKNYPVDVPLNSRISKVVVHLVYSAQDIGHQAGIEAQLVKDGVPIGQSQYQIIDDYAYSYGAMFNLDPAELGVSLAGKDVNSSEFGIAIKVTNVQSFNTPELEIEIANIDIIYSEAAGEVGYHDNPSISTGGAISGSPHDPADGSRLVVQQTYQEADPFSANSEVNAGQNAQWDFSLHVDESASGIYCIRVVKEDGSQFSNYIYYPEIMVGESSTQSPTLEQQMRGGQSVINGVKSPFSW